MLRQDCLDALALLMRRYGKQLAASNEESPTNAHDNALLMNSSSSLAQSALSPQISPTSHRSVLITVILAVSTFFTENDLHLTDLAAQVVVNILEENPETIPSQDADEASNGGGGGSIGNDLKYGKKTSKSVSESRTTVSLFELRILEVVMQSCLGNILVCCRSPLLQGGALHSILMLLNTLSHTAGGLDFAGRPGSRSDRGSAN